MDDEKNKVSWVVPIFVAVIGALGMIGAALLSNFDKIFPQDKPTVAPVHVESSDTPLESTSSASIPKQEITTSTVSAQRKNLHLVNDFNKSDFLFKHKKIIEDRPEIFSDGRISLTVRNSSDYECTVRISQFFQENDEKEYKLVKGSPLEISVGEASYILHFTDGVYREYCILSSHVAI
ncbi:hypothetical protein [Candidatus Electrothrix sp.]|uniref:hypothetical protein n=1 Tax=Candidatus Electrothrix sp. TaxID=2170559 RepID=UPI004057AEE1